MSDRALTSLDRLILFLVFSLPIMQPFVQVGRYPLVLTDLSFLITAAVAGIGLLRGKFRPRLLPWFWTLAAYALTLAASTAASESPRRSLVKLLGELYLLAMAALVAGYASDELSLKRVVRAWIAGTAATVAAAIAGLALFAAGWRGPDANMFLMGFGSLPPGPYPRVMALFQNANMMCTYVAASALVVLGAWSTGWLGDRPARLLVAGCVAAATSSVSPGLGGLFLSFALWYRATPSARVSLKPWALAAGAAAAAAFFAATLVSPPSALQTWEPSSRVMTWKGAWQTFLAHPWLGRGLGLEVADVRYLNASGSLELLTDAHNTWLSVLAQNGIFAGLAFAAVVGVLLRRSRLLSAVRPASRLGGLRIAIEAALVGGLLYQTLTGSWENTRHIWVLMALAAAVQELDAAEIPERTPAWTTAVAG